MLERAGVVPGDRPCDDCDEGRVVETLVRINNRDNDLGGPQDRAPDDPDCEPVDVRVRMAFDTMIANLVVEAVDNGLERDGSPYQHLEAHCTGLDPTGVCRCWPTLVEDVPTNAQ